MAPQRAWRCRDRLSTLVLGAACLVGASAFLLPAPPSLSSRSPVLMAKQSKGADKARADHSKEPVINPYRGRTGR